MSNKLSLNIDPILYKTLKQRFKDDEKGLNQFITDAIKKQLSAPVPIPEQEDDLQTFLQQGSSGIRTYGIKGQGW